ncbi:MAG: SRPBCC family protein [Actinobacteria bacterium]|nr:SRPBCC family protein [Actinomycetota bacterium]
MTARFVLQRVLPISPEVTWRLITEPSQMNRWSTAAISANAAGVYDRMDAVGALRHVDLPYQMGRLREVVEYNVYPRIFRYRVYDGGPLLIAHHGEQRIADHPTGCVLTWAVELDLISGVASHALARVIRHQVSESLDTMVEIAASGPPLPGDGPPALSPPPMDRLAISDLITAARRCLDDQRATADRLAAAGDPKQWFARVYQYVTEEMISAVDGDSPLPLGNPDWVMTLIPTFHDYFRRNLDSYERDEPTEHAWQIAWSTCEEHNPNKPFLPVMKGLLAGVSAHIDADLPRALADVALEHYPDRDLREFRSDYLRLAPIFTTASERLLADLPRDHKPWWTPAATRVHPQLRDALLARNGYHVGRHRVRAFAEAVKSVQAISRERAISSN